MTGCVLDTDVVIAVLDRSDASHRAAARSVKRMIGEGTPLFLCLVNYAEALVRPADDPEAMRTAIDAIGALGVHLVAATAPIARDAARLRGSGISLPDGFALATARARGAAVATFDRRVRRAAGRAGLELAPVR
ncbi:MAG: hypothetical protein QOH76_2770 [Thermoleophilaceae bacterium]|nr:hypothetical protein [Thermoleophilaceae bacterium]